MNSLEKGANLIEVIPEILLRFRKSRISVTAEIKQAFLQIGVHEKDRDFMRFLWMDQNENMCTFRHRRVVSGVTCSQFLLGATIERHLKMVLNADEEGTPYSKETVRLLSSFNVDNCVTSVSNKLALDSFMQEASTVMLKAKFDLRGWEHSGQ
ncbi:uncharacterized protein LOC126266385 [Aethina tumida]|uniref:uncharacterized protein LOC126266385 n=1 Tax=Aethina tumida TaxID=116153 RepID=UPI0021477399|nr:uncharacterized protein LOC126266385 [Aethina tumida]